MKCSWFKSTKLFFFLSDHQLHTSFSPRTWSFRCSMLNVRKWSSTTWLRYTEVLPLVFIHGIKYTVISICKLWPKSTHIHIPLEANNKFGCSSAIHYVCTDPGGWSALSSSLAVPPPPLPELNHEAARLHKWGKSNFKRLEMSSLDLRSVWHCHVHTAIVCEVRTSQTLLLWMQIGNTIRRSHRILSQRLTC